MSHRVRSTAVVLATTAVLFLTLVPTALAANIKASVHVDIVCTPAGIIDGEQAYTIDHYATVSGFPANTPGNVVIIIEGAGDFREIQITTDAGGAGTGELLHVVPNTGPIPGTYWEATATFGGETATVDGFINCGGEPTVKEECKKGAAAVFGIFKNQGDCVSFVSTEGGNSPAGP